MIISKIKEEMKDSYHVALVLIATNNFNSIC